MADMPNHRSDALIDDIVTARFDWPRQVLGAMLLALFAAVVVGTLLQSLPQGAGGSSLPDLVPLDTVAASSFTA
jgi:hypothetical protein